MGSREIPGRSSAPETTANCRRDQPFYCFRRLEWGGGINRRVLTRVSSEGKRFAPEKRENRKGKFGGGWRHLGYRRYRMKRVEIRDPIFFIFYCRSIVFLPLFCWSSVRRQSDRFCISFRWVRYLVQRFPPYFASRTTALYIPLNGTTLLKWLCFSIVFICLNY